MSLSQLFPRLTPANHRPTSPADVAGGLYGEVVQVLKRPIIS